MNCRRYASSIALAALAIASGNALAITNNYARDFDHPYVGLVVFYDADDNFLWRCSGALISATKLLTAGHCADTAGGAVKARVWFEQDAGTRYDASTGVDPVTGYPNVCVDPTMCKTSTRLYNFSYPGGFPDTRDVGLVVLDEPMNLAQYGELAPAATLDGLAIARGTRGTIFTVSGYGLSRRSQDHSPLGNVSFRERLEASSMLVNLTSALTGGYNLQTQGNGNVLGGTCNGDSGGPIFLGESGSHVIVGVTSFGLNELCRGTDFYYRTDREAVLDWIESIQ